jgi:pentatricopeptide repeat protein
MIMRLFRNGHFLRLRQPQQSVVTGPLGIRLTLSSTSCVVSRPFVSSFSKAQETINDDGTFFPIDKPGIASIWKKRTENWLGEIAKDDCSPLNHLSSHQVLELEQTIAWCAQHGNNKNDAEKDSTQVAMQLLKGLPPASSPNRTKLLNTILQNWRRRRQLQHQANPQLRHPITSRISPSDMLEQMDDLKVVPNPMTYSLILEACMANVGLADQILERALQENKASFPVLVVDTIVISSAMNAWVKSIQGNNPTKDQAAAARVEELFHLILAHGLDPDVVAYTLVLQAWAKVGRMDRVDFWWDAMADNDQDIRPTAQTIQALLLAMCNDKNSTVAAVHEAETFLIQLSKNKNEEEEPLVTTLHWNIVLDAHVKLGNLRRAEELLMRLSEATVVSYCTVMNGWARQGNPQRVEAIMERMLDAGISLQTMVYNTLLLAWSRVKSANDNKVEAAKRAMWILQQMQREQQQSTSTTCTTTSTTGPDIITYNTVLQCFATAGMMSEAQELLAEMQQDSIVDIISYNTLLMAFARARQPYKAEALL